MSLSDLYIISLVCCNIVQYNISFGQLGIRLTSSKTNKPEFILLSFIISSTANSENLRYGLIICEFKEIVNIFPLLYIVSRIHALVLSFISSIWNLHGVGNHYLIPRRYMRWGYARSRTQQKYSKCYKHKKYSQVADTNLSCVKIH